jgi:inosine-uridine nucleoside N-ribohydrolase
VFESGIDMTMVGLDITHKALFESSHAERLRGRGKAGKAVAELADFFLEFHRRRYRFDGAPIHDAMAVAHVIDPTLVTTLECNISIETESQFCDGRTVVDRWLVTDLRRNAHAGIDVDAHRFLELLVERIGSLA